MKKVYTKPEMEVVSFSLNENLTTDVGTSGLDTTTSVQAKSAITTINY